MCARAKLSEECGSAVKDFFHRSGVWRGRRIFLSVNGGTKLVDGAKLLTAQAADAPDAPNSDGEQFLR
jgi:hypothetical protein